VLILDEAHLLSGEQLDQVRMLTIHNMDCPSPLAKQGRLNRWYTLSTHREGGERVAAGTSGA
jgi:type II secretory pathway predicted ATPase ExeA